MSTINEFLNQHYGTVPGTSIEKTAGELSDEDKTVMFAKLAKDNGIDLLSETDERLEELFNHTFGVKEAGEMPPQFAKKDDGEKKDDKDDKAPPFAKKDDKKDEEAEKKAAAEAEFNEKKAAQQKFEEADFLGRTMAHAYVNEMRKIAAAATAQPEAAPPAAEPVKTASAPTESLRDRLLKIAAEEKKDDKKPEDKDDKKDEKSAPPWMKDKEASAFEGLAVERAMHFLSNYNKTAEQPFDVKIAADRLAAVATLTLGESEKVASAADAETGLSIRALEYLEAAGYPVNWA